MAKVKDAKQAVKSANEYVDSDKNKAIDGLIGKIKNSKYSKIDEAIIGIMHHQVEILELMKK